MGLHEHYMKDLNYKKKKSEIYVKENRQNSQVTQKKIRRKNVGKIFFKSVLGTRIRIRWSDIRIRILLSSRKCSKKNLDSYCFVTLFDFLS